MKELKEIMEERELVKVETFETALSNFPVFDENMKFYDLKDPINVISGNLEAAQEKLAEVVAKLKEKNILSYVWVEGMI